MALAGVTDQIIYLEEGDVVDLQVHRYWITDIKGQPAEREVRTVHAHSGAAELGPYRHYMQKEILNSHAPFLTRWKAWQASCRNCSATKRTASSRKSNPY
jgi:glucosamine 6-phosphate synthetase-like amidotransferase/phosphosugar isomerase protein